MLDWLKDWQVLVSGVLALVAGAFILIQGKMLINFERQKEIEARQNEDKMINAMIRALRDKSRETIGLLAEHDQLRSDFEQYFFSLSSEAEDIRPPSALMTSRMFELSLHYLAMRGVKTSILVATSDVVDRMTAFNVDFQEYTRYFDHGVQSLQDRRRQLSLRLDQPAFEEQIKRNRVRLIDEINVASGTLRRSLEALQIAAETLYNAGQYDEIDQSEGNKRERIVRRSGT
jgi:hypothetical protein